jgi:anti-sigma factor (TIGR02949 family)
MNPSTSPAPVSPIDCRTAVLRLWDFLDKELDAERIAEVDAHVASCAGCGEHYRFARAFLEAVVMSWQELPEPVRLRQRVMQVLQQEGLREA